MVNDLPTNITGIVSFFDYVIGVEPLFFIVMFAALWIIMFATFIRFGASRSWTYSSLICFISSVGISVIGWMNVKWVYLFAVFVAIGVFWRSLESGEGE